MSNEFLINIPEINCFVEVFRSAIPKNLCHQMLSTLEEDCIKKYPIQIYGKTNLQARTNCLYANEEISKMEYSNTEIPSIPWKESIEHLRYLISNEEFIPNSCLVNGYIGENDYVGPHRDKGLHDGNNMVCTVSFGGTRRFLYEPYDGTLPHDKTKKIGLTSIETYLHEGDVVYMYGDTNIYFKHSIPKYRKRLDPYVFSPRYSCTFRLIKDSLKTGN